VEGSLTSDKRLERGKVRDLNHRFIGACVKLFRETTGKHPRETIKRMGVIILPGVLIKSEEANREGLLSFNEPIACNIGILAAVFTFKKEFHTLSSSLCSTHARHRDCPVKAITATTPKAYPTYFMWVI